MNDRSGIDGLLRRSVESGRVPGVVAMAATRDSLLYAGAFGTGQTGNGLLLGNILTTALNSLGATPQNLADLSNNLNALLAKVVGVLNTTVATLPLSALTSLPAVLQTLALPTLIAPSTNASISILDLAIASRNGNPAPPVDLNLLGIHITTSNVTASLTATTGNGQLLGNLLYNVANLLNSGNSPTLLSLLAQLGEITV